MPSVSTRLSPKFCKVLHASASKERAPPVTKAIAADGVSVRIMISLIVIGPEVAVAEITFPVCPPRKVELVDGANPGL